MNIVYYDTGTVYCDRCKDFVFDDHKCISCGYYKIDDLYYCDDCIFMCQMPLTEDLYECRCTICGTALKNGDDGFEVAEDYYKIDDDVYCVNCIKECKKEA